jgi:hypothetical protein
VQDNVWLIAAAWMGLALLASLISIRVGISVALIEILVGIVAGNFLGFQTTPWIDFTRHLWRRIADLPRRRRDRSGFAEAAPETRGGDRCGKFPCTFRGRH